MLESIYLIIILYGLYFWIMFLECYWNGRLDVKQLLNIGVSYCILAFNIFTMHTNTMLWVIHQLAPDLLPLNFLSVYVTGALSGGNTVTARINSANITALNGVVHHIDQVLGFVYKTVFEEISLDKETQ